MKSPIQMRSGKRTWHQKELPGMPSPKLIRELRIEGGGNQNVVLHLHFTKPSMARKSTMVIDNIILDQMVILLDPMEVTLHPMYVLSLDLLDKLIEHGIPIRRYE